MNIEAIKLHAQNKGDRKLLKLLGEPVEEKKPVKAEEWQPIETAPKDGTLIILGYTFPNDDYDNVSVGYWGTRGNLLNFGWCDPLSDNAYGNHPTHWQPFPTPPPQQNATTGEGRE